MNRLRNARTPGGTTVDNNSMRARRAYPSVYVRVRAAAAAFYGIFACSERHTRNV